MSNKRFYHSAEQIDEKAEGKLLIDDKVTEFFLVGTDGFEDFIQRNQTIDYLDCARNSSFQINIVSQLGMNGYTFIVQ